MIGESLRDGAVLIAVFGWLDRAVRDEPFWGGTWPAWVFGIAAVALAAGLLLERARGRG